jgi:cytochrome b561
VILTSATLAIGFAVLLLLILREEWRLAKQRAAAEVEDSFSHARNIYPHAAPMKVLPGKYLSSNKPKP